MSQRLEVLQFGNDRMRIGAWRGDAGVGYVAPPAGRPTDPDAVRHCLDTLGRRGFGRVLTSALTPIEAAPFRDLGFTEHERLHLLRHPLSDLGALPRRPDGIRLRRGRHTDEAAVLAIDASSFDPFWRLDAEGLHDARTATPSHRYRVATETRRPVAYAVTGRAGRTGYLQRLAVAAPARGHGVGGALVADALRWVATRGATSLLVNTQEHNEAARQLYLHLGFTDEPDGLTVLALPLHGEAP